MSFDRLMSHKVQIDSKDDSAGKVPAWETVTAEIPVRLDSLQPTEIQAASAAFSERSTHSYQCRLEDAILAGRSMVVTDVRGADGKWAAIGNGARLLILSKDEAHGRFGAHHIEGYLSLLGEGAGV